MSSRLDERIHTMMQQVVDESPLPPVLPEATPVPVPRRVPGWAIAAAAAVAVLFIVGAASFLLGGSDGAVVPLPPVDITTIPTDPTTTTVEGTSTHIDDHLRPVYDPSRPWWGMGSRPGVYPPPRWGNDGETTCQVMCYTLSGDRPLAAVWRDLFADSAVVTFGTSDRWGFLDYTGEGSGGLFEDIGGPDDFDGDGAVTRADTIQFQTALLVSERSLASPVEPFDVDMYWVDPEPPWTCEVDTTSSLLIPRVRTATFLTDETGLITELEYPAMTYTATMQTYERWVFDTHPDRYGDLFRGPCCGLDFIERAETIPHHDELIAEFLDLPSLATATELIDALFVAWRSNDQAAVAALSTQDAWYDDRDRWDVKRSGDVYSRGSGEFIVPVIFSSDSGDRGGSQTETGEIAVIVQNDKIRWLLWLDAVPWFYSEPAR